MAGLQKFDVMIVGAGPAGTSTWLHLKKNAPGLADRTVLIDQAVFPRPKLCGGGVWAWCEDILAGLEIELNIPGLLRSEVVFRFRDQSWVYRSPRPFRMVQRADFDMALVKAALARGVLFRENESFVCAQYKDDGLEVQTSRRRYHVKALVGADGSLSAVRRLLVGAGPTCLGPAIQVTAPVGPECDQAQLSIDFSAVAQGLQGYVWHFPCLQSGTPAMHHGIVDFRIRREVATADMHRIFRRVLRSRHLAIDPGAGSSHPIRWFAQAMPIACPHVILAGDAAGIEPALGGGIHMALSYGELAAKVLKAAFDKRDFSFQGYPAVLQSHKLGKHVADFTLLARNIYGGRKNPLDEVREFFTDRLIRGKLATLLARPV